MFGTLINLGVLYWKRHSHPLNLVLLSTFTVMEAFTLGVLVAFVDNLIVLQALYVLYIIVWSALPNSPNLTHSLITLGVFIGLTLFTFQSKVRQFTFTLADASPYDTSCSMTSPGWDHGCSEVSLPLVSERRRESI